MLYVGGGSISQYRKGYLRVFGFRGSVEIAHAHATAQKAQTNGVMKKTAIYNAHPQEVKNITLPEISKKKTDFVPTDRWFTFFINDVRKKNTTLARKQ